MTQSAWPVVLGRRGAAQIEEVARWWAANRPAAPDAVRENVEKAFALLPLSQSAAPQDAIRDCQACAGSTWRG
jgi:hypothetical protein